MVSSAYIVPYVRPSSGLAKIVEQVWVRPEACMILVEDPPEQPQLAKVDTAEVPGGGDCSVEHRRDDAAIILRNAHHAGYTRSVNLGVAWALDNTEVTDLWVVNDDVLLLRGLPQIPDAPADAGLIGVLSNRAGYQSIAYSLDDIGDYLYPDSDAETMAERFDADLSLRGARFVPVPLVHGFCFRASRRCLQVIGLLDDHRFLSGYGSDYDLSLRAIQAGFTNYVYTGSFVAHVGSASAGRVRRRMLTILADNELRRAYGQQYQRAKFVTRRRLDRHLANYARLTRD